MSKGGHGFDAILTDIGRNWRARFTRWLGDLAAAGLLLVWLLLELAMKYWWVLVGVLLAAGGLWFWWLVDQAIR